ncbi:MAG TPA: hypothetical protein VFG10_17615 [Saprospiraceae bacterium]|nr:hypothetical protein [Saprospiraceae bacterium]
MITVVMWLVIAIIGIFLLRFLGGLLAKAFTRFIKSLADVMIVLALACTAWYLVSPDSIKNAASSFWGRIKGENKPKTELTFNPF